MTDELEDRVKSAALKAGVSANTFAKWKERYTVPFKWRVAIIQATLGAISLDDIERLSAKWHIEKKAKESAS